MNKNLLKPWLVIFCLLAIGLTLCACGDKSHEHTFSAEWSDDETNHWHACTQDGCTEKADIAAHAWDGGTVTVEPTEDADGVKTFTCTVCGRTRTEAVIHGTADLTVAYNANGGDSIQSETIKRGESLTLPEPTCTGRIFMGWYYDASYGNKAESVITPEANITLFARWGVYLNFNTLGGSAVKPVLYDFGTAVGKPEQSLKTGFLFTGWFYDEECTEKVWESDVLAEETTVYAGFSNTADGYLKNIVSASDISAAPELYVDSVILLNNSNINDYIALTDGSENKLSLTCKPNGDGHYIISPEKALIEGGYYKAENLTLSTRFTKVDSEELNGADTLTFNVYQAPVSNIVKQTTKFLNSSYVFSADENVYTYLSNGQNEADNVSRITVRANCGLTFNVGDFITIGSGTEAKDNDYTCKVIAEDRRSLNYTVGTGIISEEFYIIDVIIPSVDELYPSLEYHGDVEVDISAAVAGIPVSQLEANIENNKGFTLLKSTVKSALMQAPTVVDYIAGLSSTEEQAAFTSVLSDYQFRVTNCKVSSPNKNELRFVFEVEGTITYKNIKISVSIELNNTTELFCNAGIVKSKRTSSHILENYYIDGKIRFANSFSLEVNAEIELTSGTGSVGVTDISNEINTLIENSKEDINAISEAFTNDPVFSENSTELDYVDIFSIPLTNVMIIIPSTPLTIGIELNIIGQVGAKAGISVFFSHEYEELIHFTNGDGSKDQKGRYNVQSSLSVRNLNLNNSYSFELTLKGSVGFRCGMEAKISVSVAGLNDIMSVYIAASFGPYVELSGLVHFTYRNENGIKATAVSGGIYLEAGVFCNLKCGLKIIINFEADLFDMKFPIYTVGDRYIPTGFADLAGSAEDPYVFYSNYNGTGTLPMNNEKMQYIDVVTGQKEIKSAPLWSMKYYWDYPEFEYVYEPDYLDYTMEIVDAPEYQNLSFEEIKSIVSVKFNTTFEVNKNFMLSELKFKVKITYKTKSGGSFTFPLSCYRYVNYINTSGKDASEYTTTSKFVNGYTSNDMKSLWRGDSINIQELHLGELVKNPYSNDSLLPKLFGYYLDPEKMWTRYKVRTTNTDSLIIWEDTEWDGVFEKIKYSDLSEYENFYYDSYMYVLNWKPETFTAKVWVPTFDAEGVENGQQQVGSVSLKYNGYNFTVDGIKESFYPEVDGKRYVGHAFEGGSAFDLSAGYFYVTENMRENDFAELRSGADFVAAYEDLWSFTETFYLTKETLTFESITYNSYIYKDNSADEVKTRKIPAGMQIGDKFTVNGVEYKVVGYQLGDIGLCKVYGYNFYTYESLPPIGTNRGVSFIVLCEETSPVAVASYTVRITLTDIDGNAKTVANNRYPATVPFSYSSLKSEIDDLTVMRAAMNQSVSLDMFDSYSVTWPAESAITRSNGNYYIDLSYTYTEKDISVRFETNQAIHRFVGVIPVTEGSVRSVTLNGKYKPGKGNAEYYTMPELYDYVDEATKEYCRFVGWRNSNGEIYYSDVKLMFIEDKTYTPYFEKTPVVMTVTFINTNDYGNEYIYDVISGNYYGMTLANVIASSGIAAPARNDAYGKTSYSFKDWGVKSDYIIGTEKDSNGVLRREVTFYATYDAQKTKYTVTLNAEGGQFANQSKKAEITDYYDAVLNLSSYKPQSYTANEGTYVFAYWTDENGARVSIDGSAIGIGNKEYRAHYTLNPKKVTVTIKGHVTTEASDGSGNVYFNGDKSKTELVVSDYYGTVYNLYATMFAVDSASKLYLPKYITFTVDGTDYTVDFINVNALAYLPLLGDCEVNIFFEKPVMKEERIAFISSGKCYELDGTEIAGMICNGSMANCMSLWVLTANHGESVLAPSVYFYSDSNYIFEGWAEQGGSINALILPGEAIVADREKTYVAVYRHDTNKNITLTFNAFTKNGARREDADGTVIDSLQSFDDGSITLYDYGKEGANVLFDKIPVMEGCRFVGWTADGSTVLTAAQLRTTTYSSAKTYYAVYVTDTAKKFSVILEAGDGLFAGNKTAVTLNGVLYGKLASELIKPTANADGLVFSHYEDANGCPVTTIDEGMTLYARYAIPVSTLEDLIAISQKPNADYVLTGDIVMAYDMETGTMPELTEWTPIGGPDGFTGTFNGNGYRISLNYKLSDVDSIGLFSKIRGTVYNLVYLNGMNFNVTSGSTVKECIGGFASEITSSGRIIDCVIYNYTAAGINASGDFSYGGAIGINRGLIDGLTVAASGEVEINTNGVISIGSAVGSNFGTVRNLSATHMMGVMSAVIGKAQKKVYLGSVAGYNGGEILNSTVDPNISLTYSCGDNIYNAGFVHVGGIAGINAGRISDCVSNEFTFYYRVDNITLDAGGRSFTPTQNETDGEYYYVFGDYNQKTGLYDTCYVVYKNEDVIKHGASEYDEYTMSEFIALYPGAAGRFGMFDAVAVFNGTAEDTGEGSQTAVGVIYTVGAGEYDELPLACGYDKLKWQYLKKLTDRIYG